MAQARQSGIAGDVVAPEILDFARREAKKMLVGKTEEEKKVLRQKLMAANREAVVATGNWWMKRMAFGPYPLQEKLTLFWHGHFTTSAKDERLLGSG